MSVHSFVPQISEPFQGAALLAFFGRHAVAGLESYRDLTECGGGIEYARTLRLPSGPAALTLIWSAGVLSVSLDLTHPRDLAAGRHVVEQLCDLAVDAGEVTRHLGADDVLGPLVAAAPGLRVPGTVDLQEHLFRTLVGQQISLAGAASCTAKLVARFGERYPGGRGLTSLFPTAAALAAADPQTLPMPRARGRALVQMAEALASGELQLIPDLDPAELRARMLTCPGIGPWTADYVLMRALHLPDVLLSSDLVIRRELAARTVSNTARWAPWRSYATMYLWRAYTG